MAKFKIMVCVKQVPDPEYFENIELRDDGTIEREGVPLILNPADRIAVEQALRLKDEFGEDTQVDIITMGPPQARTALEWALAMGADNGYILSDKEFAGADTLATAYVVAAGIKSINDYDLIVCGDYTVDSGTGQVPVQTAYYLDMGQMVQVTELNISSSGEVEAKCKTEDGHRIMKSELPLVVSVSSDLGKDRLPTVSGIMKAASAEMGILDINALDVDKERLGLPGSPTKVARTTEVSTKREAAILTGDDEETVDKALQRLRELGAI